jgi:nitrogen fixation NifU-like protein
MSGASFAEVADLYQDVVMDRGRRPRHGRRLAAFDATAKGDNPMCGDRVQVFVRRDGGRVAEAAFEARGCAISIASADLMAEAAAGRTADEIEALTASFERLVSTGEGGDDLGELRALAGVRDYPSRVKCATLPWTALRAALKEGSDG